MQSVISIKENIGLGGGYNLIKALVHSTGVMSDKTTVNIKGGYYDTETVTKLLHGEGLQPGPQISKTRNWAEI